MRPLHAISLFALALCPTISSGTSAYTVWSNGALFIGEDSKNAAESKGVVGKHCKIFAGPKYVLTTSGNTEFINVRDAKTYDIYRDFIVSANSIIQESGQPSVIRDKLIKAATAFAKKVFGMVGEHDKEQIAKGGLGGTLFWFEGGQPMMWNFYVALSLKNGSQIETPEKTYPLPVPDGLHSTPHVIHQAESYPDFMTQTVRQDPVSQLVAVLDKESSLSRRVAPPYTILRMSAMAKTTWMPGDNKKIDPSLCADQSHF